MQLVTSETARHAEPCMAQRGVRQAGVSAADPAATWFRRLYGSTRWA
jgi:hypothetical protein